MAEEKQFRALPKLAVEGAKFRRNYRRRSGVSAESVDPATIAETVTRVIPKTDKDREEITARVVHNFLFNSLDASQLRIVLDAMERKVYTAGDTVIQQGDDGDEFFLLSRGECDCYLDFKNGEPPKMVKNYQPGEGFGELALMYNTPRAASIKAKTDAMLWAMDRATFRKVVMTTTSKKRTKYEGFLAKVPILQSMDKYERSKIADALVDIEVKEGDSIITEGDTEDKNFYILAKGEAAAKKRLLKEDEFKTTVKEYKLGDFFGELALINDKPRGADVVATTHCELVVINKESFERLMGPCSEIINRTQDDYDTIEKGLKATRK